MMHAYRTHNCGQLTDANDGDTVRLSGWVHRKRDPNLTLYRWMLEEYRVSLWAQQLGTRMAVSDKRLSKQWSQVEG